MDNLFKIGEIAKLFNINIRTLRYYDDIDLLKPEYIDEKTGYRYYSTVQFEQLNTIRYLRELKVPLNDIRDFLQSREIDGVKRILKNQIEEVEQKQRELEIVKRKIKSRISQIEDAESGVLDVAEMVELPARSAVIIKYAAKPDTDLEYPIRLLEKNAKPASVFLGKVGLSIEKSMMKKGNFGEYDHIFLMLDPGEDRFSKSVDFPAGKYAAIRFNGTHKDAWKNYEKLVRYVDEKGYEINGDSLEITLIDYGFTNREEQFVTEIQIPVKEK